MVLTTLTLAMTMGMAAIEEKPLVCPIAGSEVSKASPAVEYAGTTYAFCCGNCPNTFAKDPKAIITKNAKAGKVIGVSLFDPISHNRIDAKKAKGSSDYMGTRYYFASTANKATFDKSSKKYAAVPKKESLTCAVMGTKIESYSKAVSYVDHEDTRYYMCCVGCTPMMTKDAAKFAGKNVSEPSVRQVPKK